MTSSGRGLLPGAAELLALPRALGDALPSWIAEMTLATGLVLMGALVADRLLERRVSAAARVLLFAPVLLRLFLPVRFSSPLGIFGGAPVGGGSVTAGEPLLATGAAPPPAGVLDGAGLLGLGYLAVTAVLLATWALARARIARGLRGSRVIAVHPERGTPIVEHDRVGPVVLGVFRPRIVVPTSLARGEPDALAAILAHEAAHVARRDQLLAPLVQLACVVAWPILPVWIAARRIRTLVEIACDERALRGRGVEARRRYGEILVALAEGRPPVRGYLLAPSFGAELRGRLRALRARRRWGAALQGAAVLAPALALLACSGASAPAPEADGQEAARHSVVDANATQGEGGTTGPHPADVVSGQADVRGSLDKEIVRRIIRRRIGDLKACYERALAGEPDLAGRMVVEWTIAATGKVVTSRLESSTMGNERVEGCIVQAVRRWEFPKPLGGGDVVVSYPFNFSPGSGAPGASAEGPRTGILTTEPPVATRAGGAERPFTPGAPPEGLAPEVVNREMRAKLGALKACYEHELRARPGLAGRMRVHMVIGRDGGVRIREIDDETVHGPRSLGLCIVGVASKLKFPAPTNGEPVEVSFPLVFQPGP